MSSLTKVTVVNWCLLAGSAVGACLFGWRGLHVSALIMGACALFVCWRQYVHYRFMHYKRICDRLAARINEIADAGRLQERQSETLFLYDQYEAASQDAVKWAGR